MTDAELTNVRVDPVKVRGAAMAILDAFRTIRATPQEAVAAMLISSYGLLHASAIPNDADFVTCYLKDVTEWIAKYTFEGQGKASVDATAPSPPIEPNKLN